MKKMRAQPVVRTRETAGKKKPTVGKEEGQDKAVGEPVHNGSADAFQAAEGIPIDEDDDDRPRDDLY